MSTSLHSFFERHREVVLFFAKMVAAYAVWYLVYELWLLPQGRLDGWLSHLVTAHSAGLLQTVGLEAQSAGRLVWLEGTAGLKVADGCNGLSTIGLFVGFVVAYPGSWKRRLLFLPLGMLVIYAANVGRIVGLSLLQAYSSSIFDVVHGFGAPAFFYTVVFLLWMAWGRYGNEHPRQRTPVPQAAAALG